MTGPGQEPLNGPVTVIVRRRVRPGREAEYEAWLKRLSAAVSAQFQGYLGADFHRPVSAAGDYRSVFRFQNVEALESFERSELRASMLAEAAPLFAADAAWERLTGLEFWFDPPSGTRVPQPSPHRMALVLVVVVFLLVLALNALLGPLVSGWPMPLRLLTTVTLQVLLMTYIIMPRLTPRLAGFIYPKSKTH